MALSMIEAAVAVAITGERIRARDVHRIVELGKNLLQHPVELLPGIRDAVEASAVTRPGRTRTRPWSPRLRRAERAETGRPVGAVMAGAKTRMP